MNQKKSYFQLVVIILTLVLLLAACSGAADSESSEIPSQEVQTQTVEPKALEPQPQESTNDAVQADNQVVNEKTEDASLGKKDGVLNAIISNPQELFSEGRDQMAENDGGQFGSGVAEKRVNEERMELFSGDEGAYMPLNTRLRDFGSDNRSQQAILVKFQPENVNNLKFDFMGMGEFSISFEQNGWNFTDVKAFKKMAFADSTPNNFVLKGDALYYILVAFDSEANLRCMVWEENYYENQAYLEYSLYNGADDIFDSNWQMHIGFDANGQLNIYEYAVYTFDEMKENPPIIMVENPQNQGDDPGPEWAININGSFDAMSQGLVGNVELNEININSDKYSGYWLSDIMNFANAGADSATVVFGAEGVESMQVDTNNAFIAFKKNDEFMDGPYLCYDNNCNEYPVIEVQIN